MKTVTQTFVDNLKRPAIRPIRSILYKRRYWTGSSYVWESNWTALAEDKVVSVSPVTTQLDTQQQNEFKASNVTLTLQNFANEWRPGNRYGKLGPDSQSPIYGYEPFFMKWQVQVGLIYDDDSQERVPIFTGVLTELNFSASKGTVEITVTGEQALLINANAESVSSSNPSERIGTGNGSTTDFVTSQNGVGIIKSVYVNNVLKSPGTDYTISQLNDPNNPAKITFAAAPSAGQAIVATYVYWFQGQKFETLVASLATQAGISSGNQQITPVIFSGSVINSHTWQTESDWEGGTLTNADTTTFPNTVHADWSQALSAQSSWSSTLTGWTTQTTTSSGNSGTWGITGGNTLRYVGPATTSTTGSAYRSQTSVTGAWQFTSNGQSAPYFWFMAGGLASYTPGGQSGSVSVGTNGYAVSYFTGGHVTLLRYNTAGGDPSSGTSLGTSSSTFSGTQTIKIVRSPAGLITVYVGGVSVISVTDTTYTSSTYCVLYAIGNPVTIATWTGFSIPGSSLTVTWQSNTFDSGATPSAWTNTVLNYTPDTATVVFNTRSSTDGSTWDSWIPVTANVIGSTLKRYFEIEYIATVLTDGTDPFLSLVTVGSTTTSTVITLSDFSGMTCHDAIQELAALANYEYGFDASENFFFRPKNATGDPVMAITQSDFLMDIPSTSTGNDQVYTAVRATYGAYVAEIDDRGGSPFAPSSRIGFSMIQPQGGNLLISADANVAAGIAKTFFSYYSKPRRKFKGSLKYLPQLDLSDVVTLTYIDNVRGVGAYYGDPGIYYGMPGLYYGGYDEQTVANVDCKVIAQRIDTEQWTCEYDFEEVL